MNSTILIQVKYYLHQMTTYVELTDGKITKVCLNGENRNLCSEIDKISVDLIKI